MVKGNAPRRPKLAGSIGKKRRDNNLQITKQIKDLTFPAYRNSPLDQVIRESDIILEVLDVRDPLASRSIEFEDQVVTAGKVLILLLNKIDLVPKAVAEEWQRYLQLHTGHRSMVFKAALVTKTSRQFKHSKESLSHVTEGELTSANTVFGAGDLLSYIKHKSLTASKVLTSITVGVLGKPNVGKSSVIASLCRSRNVVRVGGEAGITKKCQKVILDSKVKLFDSPGVIPPGSNETLMVLLSASKLTMAKDPIGVVGQLLAEYPASQILEWFKSPPYSNVEEFLFHIASARGKLKAGGAPDLEAAARSIIQDWISGKKVKHYKLPPQVIQTSNLLIGAERKQQLAIPDI